MREIIEAPPHLLADMKGLIGWLLRLPRDRVDHIECSLVVEKILAHRKYEDIGDLAGQILRLGVRPVISQLHGYPVQFGCEKTVAVLKEETHGTEKKEE